MYLGALGTRSECSRSSGAPYTRTWTCTVSCIIIVKSSCAQAQLLAHGRRLP